jgi:hypothetical protein
VVELAQMLPGEHALIPSDAGLEIDTGSLRWCTRRGRAWSPDTRRIEGEAEQLGDHLGAGHDSIGSHRHGVG